MKKRVLLIGFTVILGCGDGDKVLMGRKSAATNALANQVRADDSLVIAAAFDDFSAQDDPDSSLRDAKNRLIIVDSRTIGSSLMSSEDQISGDLHGVGWEVPEAIRKNLRSRNVTSVFLDDVALGEHAVKEELDRFPNNLFGKLWQQLRKKHPGAKAYVRIDLPGYSDDGRTAFLRFSFGPTAHGVAASYLLTKKGGRWRVAKRSFAYYG